MPRTLAELKEADPKTWNDDELALVKAAFGPGKVPHANGDSRGAMLITRNLSDISSIPIRWLWPGVIPLGKLTLFVGDPGVGKSLLTLDVASRVTSGRTWPDGTAACPLGEVLLLSAEDDPADTIRPRLDAAGAIPSLIHLVEGVKDGRGKRLFNLADDVAKLDAEVSAETRLVVIDPITAYLGGGIDSHVTSEVRGLLAPLAELAARHGVAVLGVSHLNKGNGNAMYRTTGSLAWVAAARSVWAVGRDQENPDRLVMLPVKMNLARDEGGFAYGIVCFDEAPRVAWEAARVHGNADDLLQRDLPGAKNERQEAKDWIQEELTDGELPAKDVFRDADAAGIARATLRRAEKELGVVHSRRGFGKGSIVVWHIGAPIDA